MCSNSESSVESTEEFYNRRIAEAKERMDWVALDHYQSMKETNKHLKQFIEKSNETEC